MAGLGALSVAEVVDRVARLLGDVAGVDEVGQHNEAVPHEGCHVHVAQQAAAVLRRPPLWRFHRGRGGGGGTKGASGAGCEVVQQTANAPVVLGLHTFPRRPTPPHPRPAPAAALASPGPVRVARWAAYPYLP